MTPQSTLRSELDEIAAGEAEPDITGELRDLIVEELADPSHLRTLDGRTMVLAGATAAELDSLSLPVDQRAEIKPGCVTWRGECAEGMRPCITVWPDEGRAAISWGGDSIWGEWSAADGILADDGSRYGDDGREIGVVQCSSCGEHWNADDLAKEGGSDPDGMTWRSIARNVAAGNDGPIDGCPCCLYRCGYGQCESTTSTSGIYRWPDGEATDLCSACLAELDSAITMGALDDDVLRWLYRMEYGSTVNYTSTEESATPAARAACLRYCRGFQDDATGADDEAAR